MKKILIVLASLMIISSSFASEQKLTAKEAKQIAKEAYIYAFPILDQYKMLFVQAVWEKSSAYEVPFNQMKNKAILLGPEYTAIVRPNNDTFYSIVWLDLRAEPMVISVLAIPDKRYYAWQLIDMYTHNIDYIGTRKTGFEAGKYLIAGPEWQGKKPEGVEKIIQTEGNFLLALCRTQVYSEDDVEDAVKVQNGYKVESLSEFIGAESPAPAAQLNFPIFSPEKVRSVEFITYLNFMLGQLKPHSSEIELFKKFAQIGIGPNAPFDVEKLDPEMKKAIEEGIAGALVKIEAETRKLGVMQNGWMQISGAFGTREAMQGKYLTRAAAAFMGLWGNTLEEAFYPATDIDENGEALDGSKHNYTLHFSKDNLPPVKGFWSFSMYKLPEQLFIENSINRYVISSASEDLKYNKDGSLDIYIQKGKPSADKVSNWLPAHDGKFSLQARLYWPEPESLDPLYVLPKVTISK